MTPTPARRRLLAAWFRLDRAQAQAGNGHAAEAETGGKSRLMAAPRLRPPGRVPDRVAMSDELRPQEGLGAAKIGVADHPFRGGRAHQKFPKPACMMCDGRSAAGAGAGGSGEIAPDKTHSRAAAAPRWAIMNSSWSSSRETEPCSSCPETSRETVVCETRSHWASCGCERESLVSRIEDREWTAISSDMEQDYSKRIGCVKPR